MTQEIHLEVWRTSAPFDAASGKALSWLLTIAHRRAEGQSTCISPSSFQSPWSTDWLTTSRTAYYPEVNGWDRLMAADGVAEIRAKTRLYSGSCPVTTLEPDVWIGQGAFLKSGITVGTGAIIGARTTVVKDVPPYAIVVGTPGRVLRLRFPEAVVARLLASKWWRYSIYDLFDAPMDNVEAALEVIEEKILTGAVSPYDGPVVTGAEFKDPAALLARLAPVELAPVD